MLIGVDIGGTKCAVTLGDAAGNLLQKRRFATEAPQETLQKIIAAAKELAEGNPIEACGISCGGPLDERRGLILSPPNLPGWDAIPITALLEEALGVPCGLRNDANACAMAEWQFGAGKGAENMIFLTFGTGLGAGIIANGKLLAGANGNAGEVGHIRLAAEGPVGYGKPGSFEGFCSGGGLAQLGKEAAGQARRKGAPVAWEKEKIDVAEMAAAARAGEPYAKEVFDLCGRRLGEGLAILVDLLNPERIVIGSIFARCEDLLAPAMEKKLKEEALGFALNACKIVPAALGEKIGDAAALAVAREVME